MITVSLIHHATQIVISVQSVPSVITTQTSVRNVKKIVPVAAIWSASNALADTTWTVAIVNLVMIIVRSVLMSPFAKCVKMDIYLSLFLKQETYRFMTSTASHAMRSVLLVLRNLTSVYPVMMSTNLTVLNVLADMLLDFCLSSMKITTIS